MLAFPFKNRTAIAIASAMVGAVLFSSKGILIKFAYRYPVDALGLMGIRMAIALPFYLLIYQFYVRKHHPVALTGTSKLIISSLGLLGYLAASYLDFLGLHWISASLERILLYLYPTFVLAIGWLFLKKSATGTQMVALAFTYLGIVVLFYPEVQSTQKNLLLGAGLVTASALAFALFMLGSERCIRTYGSVRFTSLAMIAASMGVMLGAGLFSKTDFVHLPSQVYGIGFLLALFCTIIPTYLVAFGVGILGASTSSILSGVGPVSAILMAQAWLGESLLPEQWIGVLLVLVGVTALGGKKR